VEELIRQALESSPMLRAGADAAGAAAEMAAGAGALPDPMVEGMLQDVGFPDYTVGEEEMSMVGVEVRQGLLYPGKRKAARAEAGARASVSMAQWEAQRRRLALAIRQVHSELYALDQELETLASSRELVDLMIAVATTRYGTGEADAGAVLRAQLKGDEIAIRLTDLVARRTEFAAELNAMRGLPAGAPLGTVDALPGPQALPVTEEIVKGSPDTAVARTRVRKAELALDVARLETRPNFYAGAALASRGGYDPVTTLRFGVELPLWSKTKQTPMAQAAERELAMAQQELAQAELEASRTTAALTARREAAVRQAERYRESLLPRTSEALAASRTAYLSGRGDFPAILESLDLWLEARIALALRESARCSAEAELMYIAGTDPAVLEGGSHENR
jgi:outer membrane protein TolC